MARFILLLLIIKSIIITPSHQSRRYGFDPEFLHADNEPSENVIAPYEPLTLSPRKNQISMNETILIKNKIVTKINQLDDSHPELVTRWLGKEMKVLLCLAREPLTSLTNQTKLVPSSVYISYDYGNSFDDKSYIFQTIDTNGKLVNSTVDHFITHPIFNTIIFVDSRHKVIFTSANFCKTIQRHMLNFTPSEVTFYENDSRVFLVFDKTNSTLYYTIDFGKTFTVLQSFVKSFSWSSLNHPNMPIRLYIERRNLTDLSSIIFMNASQFVKGKPNQFSFSLLIENVQDFYIKKDFMFAIRKIYDGIQLLISYRRGPFVRAEIPTELGIEGFFIADVEGSRIMISALQNDTSANLYVSRFDSTMTKMQFILSLKYIFAYIPNLKWKQNWPIGNAGKAFTDLYKVNGVRGVYITSRMRWFYTNVNTPTHPASGLLTLISFDHGHSWQKIQAPTVNYEGRPVDCPKCALQVSQKLSEWYPVTRSETILSSKSKPGFIMALALIGFSPKGYPSVFISHDAGRTWKHILNDYYIINYGDHGGILIAVKCFKLKGEPNEILYSNDDGQTWHHHSLPGNNLKVHSITRVPNAKSTEFILFGLDSTDSRWFMMKIDLRTTFASNCTSEDYFWRLISSNSGCALGKEEIFYQRKADAKCYNGPDSHFPKRFEICKGREKATTLNNTCKSDEFKCENGNCINAILRCDGVIDCGAVNSDERNCTKTTLITCKPDQFTCKRRHQCIPARKLCDSVPDCEDFSDEEECENHECEPWMFACGDGRCIYSTWKCDGSHDCWNESDEKNCTISKETLKIAFPSCEPCIVDKF